MNLTPEQINEAVEGYMQSEIDRLTGTVEALEAKLERAEGQVRAMREDAKPAAPEVIMDANGNYWRRYEDGTLSMCPVSTDNLPLAEPVVVYSKEGDPR